MESSHAITREGLTVLLHDRYPAVDLFVLAPALALEFEPVLARLDGLLDHGALFRPVRDDLARRHPHTRETGRSDGSAPRSRGN